MESTGNTRWFDRTRIWITEKEVEREMRLQAGIPGEKKAF